MIKTGTSQVHSYIEQKEPFAFDFGLLDQDEILRSSVVSIKNERIYDGYSGSALPNFEGVNDPRMGTLDRDRTCFTCKGNQVDCPGHFGHIELAKPVFHVGLVEYIRKILKCVCFSCGKLLYPREKEAIENIRKYKRPKDRFNLILKLTEKHIWRFCDIKTDGCGMKQPKFIKKSLSITVEYHTENSNYMQSLGYTSAEQKETVQPEEVYRVFQKIPEEEQELMGIIKPQNMIIKRLLVAPPPVRPSVSMGSGMKQEDDLTYSYQQILKHNNILQQQINKGANSSTINELRTCLQYYVATLMDNEIAGQPTHKHKSGKALKAIRSRLKGKEGRIRGNLMGKRVDFSARSVITADPNLMLDQLGVPEKIAMGITIPETVTPQNIDELRQLVNNGPTKWPGAKYIIRHDERQIDISMLQNRCDAHIEYGYKVERHLKDGDQVLFNRQPSLHKMSIMGHRVKVLPYSTFRLNLSVTSPYNADFDGDEMNMFVPQSYESLAEVKEIMAVPLQIISPQSNRPVMGIVQDSLLGVMLFTRKDTFIDLQTAMNLMMWLGDTSDRTLPNPAILMPKPLWTGKQILSMVIPNVNLIKFIDGPMKKGEKRNWSPQVENIVLVQRGQIITGFFNKSIVGPAPQGLIHIIWKECGPLAARDFLSNTQNIVNQWLASHGFTVGVQDIIASKKTKDGIQEKLDFFHGKVHKLISQAERGLLSAQPGKNLMESFEFHVNNKLNQARDEAGQLAFKDLDPYNKIQNMVGAGSKGTNINISQIMGCVGQQNVEGKRIPFGFKNRTLPHFSKFDFGPQSKGFVKSNYLSGLDPSELFFHAMGGREGLIDTAVKTSETGYIQRRLMKALEDVMVKYDATVRNSTDQVIQFLYGEDGMAGEHIEDLKIDLLKMGNEELNHKYSFIPEKLNSQQAKDLLKKSLDENIVERIMNDPNYQLRLEKEKSQIMQDRNELRKRILKHGDDMIHMPVNIKRLILNCSHQFGIKQHKQTTLEPLYVVEKVNQLVNELTVFPGRKQIQNDDYFKEANENSTQLFKIFMRSELSSRRLVQQERLSQPAFDWLIGEIKSKFESSLIHPGEMVGSIAAHSLGEPATQMTLNTFHFAGVSSKNVTLGVPRLKEVINVARNIKTPMISIYLRGEKKKNEKSVMMVQSAIEHTTLGNLLERSSIFYDPDPKCTVVKEDQDLVSLYNDIPDLFNQNNAENMSPWLLRLKLDPQIIINRNIDMEFINKKLCDTFGDQISVMASDSNDSNLVLRLRFKDVVDDPEEQESAITFLKEIEDSLLNDFTLKGLPEISKVYAKKYSEIEYEKENQSFKQTSDNWMLETDGVALQKILPVKNVDYKRTYSNDVLEIQNVLGIEAVRLALINEFRHVLSFYGIYVNYRHLATLCDVMSSKGRLISITRHGINRLDTGPLRKCSFEETVEILLEAAVFNERDPLKGISECIITGKLAPLGTGSFDVVLDSDVIQENAQANLDDELMAGQLTPVLEDHGDMLGINYRHFTAYADSTPQQNQRGQTSEYGRTPGQSVYDAAFSPGQNYQSPQYFQSPNPYSNSPVSPQYRACSPAYTKGGISGQYQSPIYVASYQSPIYQVGSEGLISPTNQSPNGLHSGINQSPNYSPNSVTAGGPSLSRDGSIIKSYSPSYLGSKHVNGSNLSSPSNAGSPASPNYSPPREIYGSHRSGNSAYSPTGAGAASNHSPNYSPTTPNYGSVLGSAYAQVKANYSPSYSPTTPQFTQSPRYNVNRVSPRYSVGDSPYTGVSPKSMGSHHEDNDGNSSAITRRTHDMYIPSSPAYGSGSRSNRSGGGSVLSMDENNISNSVPSNIQPTYDPTKTEDTQ